MLESICKKIKKALPGAIVLIKDETNNHLDHTPGRHMAVKVIYDGFQGKTLVEQHQMIYNILQEELKEKIHALKIQTEVPKHG